MDIGFAVLVLIFALFAYCIYSFVKEYPDSQYDGFELIYHLERFDVIEGVVYYDLVREYRRHRKHGFWQEKVVKGVLRKKLSGRMVVKTVCFWKNVSKYRAKELNIKIPKK